MQCPETSIHMRINSTGAVEQASYERVTTRVSSISMAGNVLLALFKFIAGILGHSGAMISDAVHSSSDVLGSLIVIIGVKISGKDADKNHPYGHERFESVASILLSVLLLFAAVEIAEKGIVSVWNGDYRTAAIPGGIALIAAVISIVSKEAMYHYTMHYAKILSSGSLKAEAWHHRSDSLSSIGSLIGIAGARLGFPILDPIAAVIISLFILKAAYDIFMGAIDQMTDHAGSKELEKEIRECVLGCSGIRHIDILRTREFGRKIYVDLEVSMDSALTLEEAHENAEAVHHVLEERFPELKHVMVHVNPD